MRQSRQRSGTAGLPSIADMFDECRHGSSVPQPAVSNRSKAAAHSITSSASASSVGGTSMARALAVKRLMTMSNFVVPDDVVRAIVGDHYQRAASTPPPAKSIVEELVEKFGAED